MKKQKIIIGIIAVIVLIAIMVIVIVLPKDKKEKETIGADWADLYYEYLQDPESEFFQNRTDDLKNCEIQFLPREGKYPMMVTYCPAENNATKWNILYIDDAAKVQIGYVSFHKDNYSLKLMYDEKEEKYGWYIYQNRNDTDFSYDNIEKLIAMQEIYKHYGNISDAEKDEKYIELRNSVSKAFYINQMPPKEIKETSIISIFETYFTDPENTYIPKKIKLDNLKDADALKEALKELLSENKTFDEVISDEVKKTVADKHANIESRKAAIEKKEEEDKKSLKVGNYTMKYGTYKGYVGNSATGENFVLKQNSQCEYGGQSCTYTVGTCNMSQDITVDMQPCLKIKYGRYDSKLFPKSNSEFHDGDMKGFKYQG